MGQQHPEGNLGLWIDEDTVACIVVASQELDSAQLGKPLLNPCGAVKLELASLDQLEGGSLTSAIV